MLMTWRPAVVEEAAVLMLPAAMMVLVLVRDTVTWIVSWASEPRRVSTDSRVASTRVSHGESQPEGQGALQHVAEDARARSSTSSTRIIGEAARSDNNATA
jgi:hypothetical protein